MKPNEQLANEIIKELTDANCTPDEMLGILKMAKEKYLWMKYQTKEVVCISCGKKYNIAKHLPRKYICNNCMPFKYKSISKMNEK